MIQVNFSKSAEKSFLKLRLSDQKKIAKAIDKLEENPISGEKLKGEYEGLWRVRAWPYRIIYRYDPESEIIEVVSVGHRQGVYK